MKPIQQLLPWLLVLLVPAVGCQNDESDLEEHAAACEDRCAAATAECSNEDGFSSTWTLSCEVACNLDYTDETRPFAICMDAASTCEAKDACVNPATASSTMGGSDTDDDSTTGSTTGNDDSGQDDTTTTSSSTTTGDDASTGSMIEGHECCDPSTTCLDADVAECTCAHMPECCSGTWNEDCVSIAVANGCIDYGCGNLDGWAEWNCICDTTEVFCPDDPFVGQLYFPTDACGLTEVDALAVATAACEQGSGDCEVGAGSCNCECSDTGDVCDYQPG